MSQTILNCQEVAEVPRIYIASLADDKAGHDHGCWIDAYQPFELINRKIRQMLSESPRKPTRDWAIKDSQHFGDLKISEYTCLEHVAEVASGIVKHGQIFATLTAYLGGASYVDEALRYFEEGYRGEWSSLGEYAQDFMHEYYGGFIVNLPDFIKCYIDYVAMGEDMELSSEILALECNDSLHIFSGHM